MQSVRDKWPNLNGKNTFLKDNSHCFWKIILEILFLRRKSTHFRWEAMKAAERRPQIALNFDYFFHKFEMFQIVFLQFEMFQVLCFSKLKHFKFCFFFN